MLYRVGAMDTKGGKTMSGSPSRVRSGVPALRGRCPGPLDDGAMFASLSSNPADQNPGSSPSGSAKAQKPVVEKPSGTQTAERFPRERIPDHKHLALSYRRGGIVLRFVS